jgi:hypothetical protein
MNCGLRKWGLPAPYFIIGLFALIVSHAMTLAAKKGTNDSAFFRLPVWIQTNGNPLPQDLSANEFQINHGKLLIEPTSLRGPKSPTMLFVALDAVGDVANITEARNAVIHEIHELGSQYWVGLISANEQITVIQEPTPSRDLITEKIEQLSQIGKAGLLDTLLPVADLATSVLLKSDVRVAVIFITDSDIGNYKTDYLNAPVNASDSRDLSRRFAGRALQEKITRMSKAISKFQVPILVVHIAPGQDPLNRAYQNGLKQLAEIGGGKCLLSKSIGDIPSTIHEAFEWAQSFYLLGFRLTAAKGHYADIEITLAPKDAQTTSTYRLVHPNRIYMP